jgi:hypothetical protein
MVAAADGTVGANIGPLLLDTNALQLLALRGALVATGMDALTERYNLPERTSIRRARECRAFLIRCSEAREAEDRFTCAEFRLCARKPE